MIDAKQVEALVRETLSQLLSEPSPAPPLAPACAAQPDGAGRQQPGACYPPDEQLTDICSPEVRAKALVANAADAEALAKLKAATNARVCAGRAGCRLNTQTMLTLRANHATARDSVFQEVDEELLTQLGLFTVQSRCPDKNTYLTRPDLGRKLSDQAVATLREKCKAHPRVQIYVSDGLSSKAIEANVRDVLPALLAGLESYGIEAGTPFFLKHGRVAAEDHVSEVLGCEVICVLIGERPGLSTAESMSAYIAYQATVGMPEARRTVVSNIHKEGINSVEAGAYLADIIRIMLEKKASGVELSL